MKRERIKALLVLFGLPDSFSERQLKEAYRDLIQVWHPDRHGQNDRLRRKAEERLKEINQGEALLSSLLIDGRFDLRNDLPSEDPPPRQHSSRPTASRDTPLEPEPDDGESRGPTPWLVMGFCALALVMLVLAVVRKGFRAPDTGGAEGKRSSETRAVASKRIVKSERIDARNGFKDFAFGMSVAAVRELQVPDEQFVADSGTLALLAYTRGTVLELGDYAVGRIELQFNRDQLHRMEIGITRNQDKIYQAFVAAFGEPNEVSGMTRNGRSVRARTWQGDHVSATILAETTTGEETGWDTVVMSELQLSALALADQNAAVASSLPPSGFKSLAFGMSAAQVNAAVGRRQAVVTDAGVGGTRLDIAAGSNRALASLGLLPLDEIRCHFFQDALYRIDLMFSKNGDSVYQAFAARFPGAADNTTWKRGGTTVAAKQWSDPESGAAILGLGKPGPRWDQVILFQPDLLKARKEYQDSATDRAAKDI